ncbi:MAG: methyltransferase domain-containing protein [Candidatus Diapherotrites archaeon]|nr:methyltransferase domain-containing protein [Candidatus Diapherotrites archaeon]
MDNPIIITMQYGKNEKAAEGLVRELYEKWPYPSREIGSGEMLSKYHKWVSKIFTTEKNFWKEKKVFDVGCGTGELANSIALQDAKVLGIDFSGASIGRAKKLEKTVKSGAKFEEKNVFEFKSKKKFDVVIALGSLHHTIDAKRAFKICAENLKDGGIIIVGLYNKYSRLRLRMKRTFIGFFCGNNIGKRVEFGKKYFGGPENETWIADKYGQVHESYHSVGEVLEWFRENGIEFVNSKPKFKKPLIDEIKWLFKKENAFFVMVGKKNEKNSKSF